MTEEYKSISGVYDNAAITADSAGATSIQTCTVCQKPFSTLGGMGHYLRDRWVCDPCLQTAKQKMTSVAGPTGATEDGRFLTSLLFGVGASIIGIAVYAEFTIITHIYIGYMALLVGWMIAKAMMVGSKGVGSLQHQVVAMVLTYLTISLAAVPILLAVIQKTPGMEAYNPMEHVSQLAFYGLFSPFLRLRAGISHVIGLVILFVGLRIAWRVAAGNARLASKVLESRRV